MESLFSCVGKMKYKTHYTIDKEEFKEKVLSLGLTYQKPIALV